MDHFWHNEAVCETLKNKKNTVKIISIDSSTNTTCDVIVFRLRDASNNQTIGDNDVDNPFNFVIFGN